MSTETVKEKDTPSEEILAEATNSVAESPTEAMEEAAADTPTIETLQTDLKAARTEAAKNLDGWQRSQAELVNFKKRQVEQSTRRLNDLTSQLISQIFPVLDDLDLAFQNIPDSLSEQEENWVEGFTLVQRKLLKILENNQVEIISTEGEFDPNLHEAVTHEDSPDHESNAIIAELRKGYKLKNRVLRPSLVRVAQ